MAFQHLTQEEDAEMQTRPYGCRIYDRDTFLRRLAIAKKICANNVEADGTLSASMKEIYEMNPMHTLYEDADGYPRRAFGVGVDHEGKPALQTLKLDSSGNVTLENTLVSCLLWTLGAKNCPHRFVMTVMKGWDGCEMYNISTPFYVSVDCLYIFPHTAGRTATTFQSIKTSTVG